MKLRLRSPRQFARVLLAAAQRDRQEVADYLDSRREEWEALAEAMPSDAADVLEQLPDDEVADLLVDLDSDDIAEILEEIAPELAAELVEDVPPGELAAAVSEMSSKTGSDLLNELDEELAEQVLALVDDGVEQELRSLLVYQTDTAGRLMTTEIASLPLGLTAGEAVERIRQLKDEYEDLSYVYVVDDERVLRGVISFRDLVFNRPGASLDEVMVEPVSVTPLTDRQEVAELCQRYHLLGIPIVDVAGRLLGMVTNEAVKEAIQDEATEDFAAAVGAGVQENVYTDVLVSFRMRSPWLVVNLVLALVVAWVIEQQTGIISDVPVLAALMPVVALLGGNGGNQSLAVMIRSLASGDVPRAQVPGILARQAGVGLLNGVALGLAAFVVTFALLETSIFATVTEPFDVAMVVGIAALVDLSIAAVAGSAIPLVLRALGQDPAMASSIFLTLLTDVIGFGGFLLVATALL